MIARLTGRVLEKGADHAIVDVQGVGYRVFSSLGTLGEMPPVGSEVTLRIHTHVREDTLELYGFVDEIEELVFHELIATPSIGCRKAVQILSGLPAGEIVEAVRDADAARLARAHGVGKKTAERLVLELKDRLAPLAPPPGKPKTAIRRSRMHEELLAGLVNLGYKPEAASAAADKVLDEKGEGEIPVLLRAALKHLRGGRR